MRHTLLVLLGLVGCQPADPTDDKADDTSADTDVAPLDLVSPLGADEVRAGVITDPAATIGGIGGESRPGDVLLRNDRARFVIQAIDRRSGGLMPMGGALLDADVVRDDGSMDADLFFDWTPALDVGWLPEPTSLEIVDDGMESGTAVVRVQATDGPFLYFEGVFEDPGRNAPRGIAITTTYTLEAGSPLMKVETTITAGDEDETVRPGDILHALPGVASPWVPGTGRAATHANADDAVLLVHDELGLSLGIFADDRDASSSPEAGLDLLNFLISFTSLYEPAEALPAGTSRTWTRWWGVARSPSELTDAWLARTGADTRTVEAQVQGDGAGLAGVRVTALVDDAPFTLGITDADGRASMNLPTAGTVRLVADGGGSRIVDDLPDGAGDWSPLADAHARDAAIVSVRDGATPTAHARGWGRAEGSPGDTITLAAPAHVTVTSSLTDVFEVRLRATDVPPDDALGLPVPRSLSGLGYARDGSLTLEVEPGTYAITAWHGPRWEIHESNATVTAGEALTVSLDGLTPVAGPAGWWSADTHVHAAPSFDGKLSPTDRALVSAGTGVDLWFATEHDVSVDQRRLVEALGLSKTLRPVASMEVSPWTRGHVNVFPLDNDPDQTAGGAWLWWEHLSDTTTDQFDRLLAHHEGILVQINHPFSPGLPSFAGWSPGEIRNPDYWWGGFDAVEVIVPGRTEDGRKLYADLSARGVLSAATGSSDSHDHLTNDPGLFLTWVHAPEVATAGDLTDAQIVAAFETRHTIAAHGAVMSTDPLPGSTVAPGTVVTLTDHGASWAALTEATLYKDGVVVGTAPFVDGEATLTLDADADASFVIEARGSAAMTPVSGREPWAIASAIQVDVGGDGWDPPLPPLVLR